jgi:two-component system, cell cycle sensor histidine kinase and response regulator CckA
MPDEVIEPAGARILIVEDEAIVAEDLALTLQDLGYQVVGAVSTGLLAIQMAEETKPDLILTDIKLSGEIDGIQTAEQIRARFDIPVIFLTGYEETDTISRAKVTEPYGFLAKPFSYYILKITIETALYKHAADKRVKESEERYRMLVEQSLDGIALIQGTTVRFGNPALAKMFGFENKEEAEGKSLLPFVAPEFRELMGKIGIEREEGKSVPDCYEFTALRKDGTPFTAEVKVNLTTYHGEKARQGIIRDISERKKLEDDLRQSQQMLSLAMEGANLGTWDWDLSTGKALWSERIYRMLGYAPNEFEPNLKNWKKFVHPEDWPEVSEALNLHLEGSIPKFEVQYRSRNKSGGWQWLQTQGKVAAFDSDGKPIRITGVVADITDRKKAEEALRESEDRYRQISENSLTGIFIHQDGVGVFVNQRLADMLGYTKEEMIGQNFFYAVHLDDHEIVGARVQARLRGELSSLPHQLRLLKKTGESIWCDVLATRIDYRGRPAIMGNLMDITDRNRAQEALKESEQRYRDLFQNATDAMYTHDLDGNFTSANAAAERVLGLDVDRLLTLNVREVVHPDDLPEALHNIRIKAQNGVSKTGPYEIRIRRPDATERWLEVTSRLVFENGKPSLIQGVGRDVTERKLAQEALMQSEQRFRDLTERFRMLCENAPFGMVMISKGGVYEYVNPKFTEIFGYDLSDVPNGRAWLRKGFPDEAYRHEAIAAWIEDLRRSDPGETRPRIFSVTCKDGTKKIIQFRPVKLSTGQDMMTFEDITDRVRAEEARREAENVYRTLVDTSPDPIIMYDLEGNLIAVNQQAATAYGLSSPEELLAKIKNVSDILDEESQEKAAANLKKTLATGSTRKNEYTIIRKDGSSLPVEVNSSTVRTADGAPKAFISVIRDIAVRKQAEQRLRESEERLELAVQSADLGIWDWYPETGLVVYNKRYAEMLGIANDRKAYHIDFWKGRVHPDDLSRVMNLWDEHLHGLTPKYRSEYRLRDSKGNWKWVLAHGKVSERGDGGKPLRLTGTAVDITERKQAEEALKLSDSAISSSISGIAMADFAGTIIYPNPAALRLWGYVDESEIIGRRLVDFFVMDHRAIQAWKTAVKTGSWVGDLTARRKDGSNVEIQTAATVVRDNDGKPTAIMASFLDFTGRKRAEQALRESEEKYRALFEESRDAVFMTTREGILIDANQAFRDLFGFTREETENMDIVKMYINPEYRKRFQEEVERKSSVKDYEINFRKKDGTELDCLLTSTVRRDNKGIILGYQGIIRDVTDLKKIQRQLLHSQKMEAIGTLAGGISHEFNNLLQAILGYTDLLLMRTKKTDPNHKKLEIVCQTARDGADLVSRILAVSMKAELRARPTDLNQEMRRVAKLLRRTVHRMIAIDLVLADDLWVIDADPAQIEQVILNLAVNAQHAMPDGGRLLIETSNVSLEGEYARPPLDAKPGKYVMLTVSDTGTGMEPEVVGRIFEPFFTTKAQGEGTGLGLAMVHGIVTQHGGYIRCYSEPGLGTSIKIYFPVSETERLLDVAETREMPAFGTETILLVDDDSRIRDIAQEMIKMGGYKVIGASSGEEAMEMYADQKSEISLVILDLIMPGMGGKKCLEELLRIDPDLKVLFASGYSSNGLTIDETGTGARGFIRKPYDAKDILTAIRRVLDQGHL